MKDQKITIVDYGMGNLFSIERAINYIGAKAEITSDRLKIANALSMSDYCRLKEEMLRKKSRKD